MNLLQPLAIFLLGLVVVIQAKAGDGKLIATAGTTQLEGAAGGGIVPWAVLAGYDSREQVSASVFTTRVSVDDYQLNTVGAAIGLYDRIELSAAHQTFDLAKLGGEIKQNVLGVKARLYGDVVYSRWPQISAGIQHKRLLDSNVARAVAADSIRNGTDFYLAATKVHLGAVQGYNLLWNLSLRATRANQLGLLGFGGDKSDQYKLQAEGSLALLLSRRLAIGVEYRQKPDNLSFADEDDWADVFVAWFPDKNFNLTLAWADLGSIAGADDQKGLYLSLTGYVW